ncbi:RsuA 16S rRNA uridine-516 pseudouridylate synthase and related pseudouridylate synthases [actinobacterium SCGC AAA044-D11]
MAMVRLQKILADAGIASRRASETLISEGRVSVDGIQIFELGSKFDPEISKVEVDGESIKSTKTKTYLAFYKPRGVISTMSDPEDRPNLGDFFKTRNERLFHVGRLDRESEGLILLTNDGDLTHRATHPSYGMVKKYLIEIEGLFTKENIDTLLKGVTLEDGLARALEINVVREINNKHHWVEVSIHEGRFHIVRRMFEALEIDVLRLIRTDFGPISIGETKEGRWRVLNSVEMDNLFNVLKLKR